MCKYNDIFLHYLLAKERNTVIFENNLSYTVILFKGNV